MFFYFIQRFCNDCFLPGLFTKTVWSNDLSEISNYIKKCDVGSSIIFDEVIVLAPDGKQRTIPGIGIILY